MVERLFHLYERWRAVSYRVMSPAPASREDGLPLPPGDFLMQVAGSPAPDVYLHGGELGADCIRDVLGRNGVELQGAVLDFGCGCGRVLRRWHTEPGIEAHGCDYNADLALWSRTHLPFARVAVNGLRPPAPYRTGKFDLIYAFSVITHLPETDQRPWMREFHRLLKPGGHLLVSTHGEHYMPKLTTGERSRFQDGRLVVRSARSAGSNLCNAFHPPQYFRRELAEGFEIAAHEPRGARGNPEQDLWLLRRLPG
jgi:SAM-dependent methyltransferase